MLASLLTIAALHWVVLLVPGFNFVLLGQLAASGQRPAAFAAVAGMTLGTLSWALLAVLGVGVVFAAHPALRLGMQLAGGLYLLRMAWRLWADAGSATPAAADSRPMARAQAFRSGLFTSWLNPKIALFYGSVFATAMPADPPLALQAAAVALVFGNSVLWHTSLALLLSQARVQQAWLRHLRRLNRGSAGVIGVMGGRLVWQTWVAWRANGG